MREILFSLPSTMCRKSFSTELGIGTGFPVPSSGCLDTKYWDISVELIQLSRLAPSYAGDEDHEEVAVIRHEDKLFEVCKHCQLRVTAGTCTRGENKTQIQYLL
jgi:hypothetical protein